MAKTICVDWGNSLVKVAVFNEENKIVEKKQCNPDDANECVINIVHAYKPGGVILCSVSKQSDELEKLLKPVVDKFLHLDNDTHLPIMNAYSSPETLGADRLALAVGAWAAFPNCNVLAISLGTCITYNMVLKNRPFRGGAISPGLQMRLDAMHQLTDKLPEVSLDGELLLLGYDTSTCMRSGAVFGMTAEIDGMLESFSSQYPDFNAVLTGGDAPYFANKIKSKIFADPDLLMKGLNLILKHNVPQLR
jgi:type III pantothenate kinase